jgi:hypothetical protein
VDKMKIFKEHLARVIESSNRLSVGHQTQLQNSTNILLRMYEKELESNGR